MEIRRVHPVNFVKVSVFFLPLFFHFLRIGNAAAIIGGFLDFGYLMRLAIRLFYNVRTVH